MEKIQKKDLKLLNFNQIKGVHTVNKREISNGREPKKLEDN